MRVGHCDIACVTNLHPSFEFGLSHMFGRSDEFRNQTQIGHWRYGTNANGNIVLAGRTTDSDLILVGLRCVVLQGDSGLLPSFICVQAGISWHDERLASGDEQGLPQRLWPDPLRAGEITAG